MPTQQRYRSKMWEFPSLDARASFENAVEALDSRAYTRTFALENLEEADLTYPDAAHYLVDTVDGALDGNFYFVDSYSVDPRNLDPGARDLKELFSSFLQPDIRGEIYVVDTVMGAGVAGDRELVEYFEDQLTAPQQ